MTVSKNPEDIKKLFNSIASKYDINNNLISLGLHQFIKKLAIKNLPIKDNARILDACTGTGDIAGYLSKINPYLSITGIDFSEEMLNLAKKKFPKVTFLEGDCTNLPFASESFDIITMSFGLRNIENYKQAIKECFRVLDNNGILLHLDFGKKNFLSKVFDFFVEKIIRLFYGAQLPYEYLVKSKREFFTPDKLIQEFESEGFKLNKRRDYLFGIISMQIFEKTKTEYC